MKIKFGTDGWRGVIAKDFTFENLKRVSSAYAEWLNSKGFKRVIIGYDTRFLSEEFAKECGRVLMKKGISVSISSEPSPTPEVSWNIMDKKLDGGIVITASHNPYFYNGFKIKNQFGGPAENEITSEVEALIEKVDVPDTEKIEVPIEDLKTPYIQHILQIIDQKLLMENSRKIVVDSMHGAGRGYLKTILEPLEWEVIEIRGDINPYFEGGRPEPTAENLSLLSKTVVDEGAFAGIATDGDGDRVGVVDGEGKFVTPHIVFALIFKHLVEDRKIKGKVFKNFSTSDMIDKLAKKYNVECITTPIGFKYISRKMFEEKGLMGGEESGGIGVVINSMERDGIFSALMLLEMACYRDKSIERLKMELFDEIGPHFQVRKDIAISTDKKVELKDFERIGNYKVIKIENIDGKKYRLDNGGWILLRPSGTEPLIRIYSEAPTINEAEKQISLLREMIGI
jgi:phosphomannomutase